MKKIILLKLVFLLMLSSVSFVWARDEVPFTRQSLRDPFIAPEGFEKIDEQGQVLLEKILGDVKIMGIIIDGNKKYAIINNSIVKEKEAWQELLIDKIEKDRLTVIYRGRSTTIPYKRGI
tara:strand:+ start:828 stop:1187 length:360 start_codon:yes stop_codon:yes gene_type:complete